MKNFGKVVQDDGPNSNLMSRLILPFRYSYILLLDVEAWNQVSKRLREERLKVLLSQQNIWSKSATIPTLK